MARGIKGGIKRRETDPASYQFRNSLEHTKRFTDLGREKGEGGDRGDLEEKKEVQRGRQQSGQ